VVLQLPDSKTNWQELEKQLFMKTFTRTPVTLVRGYGALVWDDNGKEYLDFVGGWAVNSLGHCHPVVVNALTEQAKTLIQVSNQFYTIPQLQLADLLIKNSCLDKIFFCNSGAEANEGAIKLVRRYGKLHLNGAYQIITTHDSFHGRTLATVAATGQIKYQEPYVPLPNGFINVNYNDINAIKRATTESTCAIMIEPIQGEGGVNVPDAGYIKEIRTWCDQKGLVLILDEVQTGIGRTGTLFGYEQFDVKPDIITLAKGLGSGVPIGAILSKDKTSVFAPGDHGSTFGGNPLVCSVSYAALKYILDNNIPQKVAELGEYFIECLNGLKSKYSYIKEVRGRGLLLALGFTNDIAQDIVKASLEKGLLVNQVKPNAIRFMPPLIITKDDIDKAVTILEEILSSR
jgi:acetylornithine/N-succinyldiaminopimelate aminotransferase